MADEAAGNQLFARSVERARAIAAAHPHVLSVSDVRFGNASASFELEIETPLPNAWKAAGQSPNGVRRIEPVRLDFTAGFPLDAPEVSLRSDFGRALAHMQPWTTSDGRPVPCIQDGELGEFFQQHGLVGILNQLVAWLDHAAEGRLIDPVQGWEPTRRDAFPDYLVADAAKLRGLVERRGGYRFQKYDYVRFVDAVSSTVAIRGEVHDDALPVNAATLKEACYEKQFSGDPTLRYGKSVALIVWPGKDAAGKEVICSEYTPETVTDLASLKARADLFGCGDALRDALSLLTRGVAKHDKAGPFSLAIVLCARRPFHLIGSDSPVELCCYNLDFIARAAFPEGDATKVRAAGHRERIAAPLLARMAGLDNHSAPHDWTLIGAGSLGSKVALHMSRAGRAPHAVIDKRSMSPHNFARHALIPRGDDMQILSTGAKVRLLSSAISGLGSKPKALPHDIGHVLQTRSLAKEAWSKQTWAVVNTTASLRTRTALAAATNLRARVIEGVLYARGALGLIATEGPERNPNCNDLFAEFYAIAQGDAALRSRLFGRGEDSAGRVATGEGCGSLTMRMTDGRISLYAAALAEYLLSRQQDGLPVSGGELVIGTLEESGLGVSWKPVVLPPVTIVSPDNDREWRVRLHARAAEKIAAEVARWPTVETGGVVVGRQDEASKSFHVVDVIEAPPDSKRSASEFVLGTARLRRTLEQYAEAVDWSLVCLGTWHSHLTPSGPSHTDRQAAQAVAVARLAPSILLIHTPRGFRALVADRTNEGGT